MAGAGSYTWGSTPELVADVQSWADTPENNFGWIMIGDEVNMTNVKRFDSRNHANATVHPVLEIHYSGTATDVTQDDLPKTALLTGNYPNPFRSQTTITYRLDTPQHVNLELVDLQGRIVRTLVHTNQGAGLHQILLEASALPDGMYIYRLTTPTSTQYKKLVLLR